MSEQQKTKGPYQKALEHLQAEGTLTNADLLSICEDDESMAEAIRQNLIVNNLAKEHNSGYGLVYAGKETVNEPKDVPPRKIFLSYGRKDASDIAKKLKETLENDGHTVWIDEAEMKGGRSWEEQIERALEEADMVISVLSPHAVRRPDGVCLDEISFARFHGTPIIPVMYKPCTPPLSIFRLDWIDLKNVEQLGNLEERLSKLRQALASGGRLSVEGIHAGLMGQLNPIDFGPELAALQQDFTGRKWLVDEIDRWLGDKDGDPVCLVTGDPGAGKSAALAHLAHRLPNVAAIHFCRSVDSQTVDPERFIRSLAAQLATQIPNYAEALEGVLHDPDVFNDNPDALFKNLIINPLTSITIDENNTPALLLVDGLDEALQSTSDQTIPKLLGTFLRELTLAKDLRLLLGSRPVPGVMHYFSGRTYRINIEASSENNRDDLQRYLEYKLEGRSIQKVLEQTSTDRQTVKERLEEKADGNFLYAEKAMEAIEKGMLDPSQPDQFPVGLTGLYQTFFERHFSDLEAYQKEVRPLLEIIVAAREPVSGQRMVAALSASNMLGKVGLDPIDPEFELNRKLHKLSALFPKNDGRYRPYHLSIAEWLRGDSNTTYDDMKFVVSPIKGHHRLADGGLRSWDKEKENLNSYDLKYLPTHLQQAGRWEELYELLTNFEYVDKKAQSDMVQELAEDFKQAARYYPDNSNDRKTVLPVLSRAMHSDIQFLMRHPDLLFQVCWNRGWWYDSPEIASFAEISDKASEGYQPPWSKKGHKVSKLLDKWKRIFEQQPYSRPWIKEVTPPRDIFSIDNNILKGHEDTIRHLAWSPSGDRLATASNDRTARIWDPDGQAEPIILKGHEHAVNHLAWSPSGDRLATASDDWTVRIWDPDGQAEPIILIGHEDTISHLAWSPSGDRLATASNDRTARIWDPDGQAEPIILKGHTGRVNHLAWSPSGDRLATHDVYSIDGTARIWDPDGQAEPIILIGDEHTISHLAWSPSGDRLATASRDSTVRIWDPDGQAEPIILKGHEHAVNHLAWSPSGDRLATASYDRTARIWNPDGQAEPIILIGHEDTISHLAWSPSGDRLATASRDSTVRIWDPDGQAEPIILKGHEHAVNHLAWSPSGDRLATDSYDRTARIWNPDGQAEPIILIGHEDTISHLAWSPSGDRLATASYDRTARIWDPDGQAEPIILKGHTGRVNHLAWSPSGDRLATASRDRTARIWNPDGQAEPIILKGHTGRVNHLAWSPSGDRLATASDDSIVRIWDPDGHAEPIILKGHEHAVNHLAWSPSGDRLATASDDSIVRIWDPNGQAEPIILKGHTSGVNHLAWSPSGDRLATASDDWTVRIWDPDGQAEPIILKGDTSGVNHLAWSPSGDPIILKGDTGGVNHLAWSPSGDRLATAYDDDTARIWDPDGQAVPIILKGQENWVSHLAWSPSGDRLATGSYEGTARIWAPSKAEVPYTFYEYIYEVPYTIYEHIYTDQLRELLENDSNLNDTHFLGYQDGSDAIFRKGEQVCFYKKSNIEMLKQSSIKNLWAGFSGSSVFIFKLENLKE